MLSVDLISFKGSFCVTFRVFYLLPSFA